MHPGFFGFWKRGHGSDCGPERHPSEHGHCGPGHHRGGGGPFAHGGPWGGGHRGGPGGPHFHEDGEGGGFGVRRPLRFLAWKLELEEEQVAKLAVILDELKTERAQAAVDQRRSIAAFADAVSEAVFDEAKVKEAGDGRVKSAEALRDAVHKALAAIHAILDDEQRKRLGYLLRTGALAI
jgi:Spy/CpxP family protein refolding chaperone